MLGDKMAAKKPKNTSGVKWVDISLSVAESKAMKEAYAQGDKLSDDLERIIDSGYKITLSADTYNECFACYIIPKDEKNPNFGMILTARGSDIWKAARGALFRHYVLFQGDKWTDHEKQVIDSD